MKTSKKAKTVHELVHHFTHSEVGDTQSRSYYKYENDIFTYGDGRYPTYIARIIDRKKKIVLINPDFDRGGSYGNGLRHWGVKYAFTPDWAIIEYTKIDELSKELTKEDKYNIAKENLLNGVTKLVIPRVTRLQELITNDSAYVSWTTIDYCKEMTTLAGNAFNEVCKIFNISQADKKSILKFVPNTSVWTAVRYKGWGNPVNNVFKLTQPLEFYLDIDNLFTEEDSKIIEFKKWKSDLLYKQTGTSTYGKTYKEIYNDPKLKADMEVRVVANHDYKIKQAEIKNKRLAEERLAKAQEDLKKWIRGHINYTYNLWGIPVHLRINDGEVETTKNARVPIAHAKLLYKKMRNCIQTDTPWHTNGSSIKIGMYKVECIDKLNNDWYIRAGCHTIYQREIELFIEDNSLESWRG